MSPIFKPRGVLLVAALALAVSGCGRRGELEDPSAAAVQTPQKDEMNVRRPSQKITPPKKDFVLDPLLK